LIRRRPAPLSAGRPEAVSSSARALTFGDRAPLRVEIDRLD